MPAAIFDSDGPGAVSEATVLAMTAGAIQNSRANLAVAVSGIAGPDGGTEEKPVGTVWIAWQWEAKVSRAASISAATASLCAGQRCSPPSMAVFC